MNTCEICGREGFFNVGGKKKEYGIRCCEHQEKGMINVVTQFLKHYFTDWNYRCEINGCEREPSFNFKGSHKGVKCEEHKEEGMINVMNRLYSNTCPECDPSTVEGKEDKRANFNYMHYSTGRRCGVHILPDMIDVCHRKCDYDGCEKRACKGMTPSMKKTNKLYCDKHKDELLKIDPEAKIIEVAHRKCEVCGETRPNYGYVGGKATRCHKHREDRVNIVDPRCISMEGGIKCNEFARYNDSDKTKALYCSKHCAPSMLDTRRYTCIHEGCKINAAYNFDGEKEKLYCFSHREKGMRIVFAPKCKMCDGYASNDVRLKKSHLCLRCFTYTYPNDVLSKKYLTKEIAVRKFIQEEFKELTLVFNKQINGGCNKRRPDILFDFGSHVIIVEVDEEQHRHYDEVCELARYSQIHEDIGYRPVIFIIFNPDKYHDGVEKHGSCWKGGVTTATTPNNTNSKDWANRLKTLKETINKYINYDCKELMKIEYLFFDHDYKTLIPEISISNTLLIEKKDVGKDIIEDDF